MSSTLSEETVLVGMGVSVRACGWVCIVDVYVVLSG